MDTRLLKHYETELSFLRDMGAEFAESYPKIAARLGMEGVEVLDPYVERLLEGVAFLSARVQLELELQFPEFAAHLFEIVYPHYLTPTPSMMVVALQPDTGNAAVQTGYVLPRHSVLRSGVHDEMQTPCTFRTAADLTLWPLEVAEAEYIEGRGPLVAAGVTRGTEARAGLRLRLRRSDGGAISALPLDRLTVFLDGQGGSAWDLHEALCTKVTGITGRSSDRRADWTEALPDGAVAPWGFARDQALLPTPRRSFDGYRLLQEYFAMPERYHFVELSGLAPALRRADAAEVDLYLLLRDSVPALAATVTPQMLSLHAVPAINLFPKRCDRVHLGPQQVEHHVVPDRTAPLDYELYSIDQVTGISGEGEDDVQFRPFYSADDFTAAGESHPAYYTQRRRLRQRSEKERLHGVRTSYLGADIHLSLVDRAQVPYGARLSQLAVRGLCTNRDLPLLLASGGGDVFHLPDGGPVSAIRMLVSPTRPQPTLAQGDTAWRLISHLSLNYLSIADTDQGGGAAALRELVGIYAPLSSQVIAKQLEGIAEVRSRPIVRRMADEVLSTAVRGIEIAMVFDESFFEGSSSYHLAAVLEQFFRRHASINSFTETVLLTQQRGEIARWQPRPGLGRVI